MRRILLVDDDPDILESLLMVLEDDYDVLVARNGKEALALCEAALDDAEPFDAIVLDIMMPVMDGAAFLAALRERDVKVPVVVVSAAHQPSSKLAYGDVTECLTKPFSVARFEEAVARAIAQRDARSA